jgi:hypothetical protein
MSASPRRFRRHVTALAATAALALAGCSDDSGTGGGGADGSDGAEAEASTPTPSTTVAVPEGVELTEPGTQLEFGDTATLAHEAGKKGGVLDIRVDSAVRGALEDFAGFELDDPYKKRGNYYYVRVTVKNAGDEPFGDVPVPLWGISGTNTLLQAVQFTSAFTKCPTEPLPADFEPGDKFKTCLVYLSPNRGTLEGLSYRPTEEYVPIEWRGEVTKPQEKKGKSGKKGKGRSR